MTPGALRRKSVVCGTATRTVNVPSLAGWSGGPGVQVPPPVDCSSVTVPLTPRTLPVSVAVAPVAMFPAGRESESSPKVTIVDRSPSEPRIRLDVEPSVFCAPSAVVTTSCRAWPTAGTGVTSVMPDTPSALDICAPVNTSGPQLCHGEARSYGSALATR